MNVKKELEIIFNEYVHNRINALSQIYDVNEYKYTELYGRIKEIKLLDQNLSELLEKVEAVDKKLNDLVD